MVLSNSFHAWARCKNHDGKWYELNDIYVELISEEKALQINNVVTLIFYRKIEQKNVLNKAEEPK
jgi:hypothetical protein